MEINLFPLLKKLFFSLLFTGDQAVTISIHQNAEDPSTAVIVAEDANGIRDTFPMADMGFFKYARY